MLNIKLSGENSLQIVNIACSCLNIIGNGSLTVKNNESSCIQASGGQVVISDSAEVTAISNNESGCGIYTANEITNSTVIAEDKGEWAALQGQAGIIIKEGSVLGADSAKNCRLYSSADIEISGSIVTALSENAAAIFTESSLTIDNSKVTAHGFYPGLRGDQNVTITNGSEIEAIASEHCGIFSGNDEIKINGSKVIAIATVSINKYYGTGWAVGDANVHTGVFLKNKDEFQIPKETSLAVGTDENEKKILGGEKGVTVTGSVDKNEKALLLPAGTAVQKVDNAQ